MAEQRQVFRFRLPWLAAPAPPRPSQTTQTVTQTVTQPAPVAPHTGQETQTPSQPSPPAPHPNQATKTPPQPAPASPRPSQATQILSLPASAALDQPGTQDKQTPTAPRPSQVTQAPSQPVDSQQQRTPLHPTGMNPAQPPPIRTPIVSIEPKSPSMLGMSKPALQPRKERSPQGPPASPSRTGQNKVTSQPASPAQVNFKHQQATKAPPQSPSTSRGSTEPTKTKAKAAPFPTPSKEKLPSPTKKPSTILSESPQYPNKLKKKDTPKSPSEDTKPELVTEPPPKKMAELLTGPKKQQAFQEPKVKASINLAAEVSSIRQVPKPQPVKDFYTTSHKEPINIVKGHHNKPGREAIIDRESIASKAQTIAHPFAELDDQRQQSAEQVHDIKEVFKKLENSGRELQNEIRGRQERGARLPHKHAIAVQKAPFYKEFKQGGQQVKSLLHEKPFSIVTLTGENTGATMHLSTESLNNERPVHIHRAYKINQHEIAEKTTVGEGSSRKMTTGNANIQEELATKSFVNNNAQGINNSLVFNSTIAERNPGVHVILSRKPVEPIRPGNEKEMIDTHKVEETSTPAERLAYAPTFRRRCLRGLFMESSDSDPEKPRRHGCPIGCTQKSKDGAINVL